MTDPCIYQCCYGMKGINDYFKPDNSEKEIIKPFFFFFEKPINTLIGENYAKHPFIEKKINTLLGEAVLKPPFF